MTDLSIALLEENCIVCDKAENVLARCHDALDLWNRSTSDTMLAMETVGNRVTPMRQMRQVAAELQRKKDAMTEAKYEVMKRLKNAQIKRRDADSEQDGLRRELLLIEAQELEEKAEMVRRPYLGAMYAVVSLGELHDKLLAIIKQKHGDLTEAAFEAEEIEYHIKRSVTQSMRDIRMQRSITAGNQEYLESLGMDPIWVQNAIAEQLANPSKSNDEFLDEFVDECSGLAQKRLERMGLQ